MGLFRPEFDIEYYKTTEEIQSEKDYLLKGILLTSFVTLPYFLLGSFKALENPPDDTTGTVIILLFYLGAWARFVHKLYLWKKLNDRYKHLLLQEAIAKGVEIGMKKAKED
ncbi:hypothetical protein [Pyrococcus horikoshii]|uniref:Uncharacterized protein n=1 Tax=Pyrococcus horikoshii TaxID=53953 RepID=A0A832T4V5_PYRHR|nr:hypothetical protein [Pyrococcus horikoshii]HII60301.1 hypothetical protein [Pyrococcus horikoshii]